jgi:hypothetical protein
VGFRRTYYILGGPKYFGFAFTLTVEEIVPLSLVDYAAIF